MNHVRIYCTDHHASQAFYESAFDVQYVPRESPFPWLRIGELEISLFPNAKNRAPGAFPDDAMAALFLEVDDFADTARRLRQMNVPFIEYLEEEGTLTVADPDGILIEVWRREE